MNTTPRPIATLHKAFVKLDSIEASRPKQDVLDLGLKV